VWIAEAAARHLTTGPVKSRACSRSSPSRREARPKTALRLSLELPLQLAHERRQPDAPFALQPLGLEDRLDLGKGLIDIAVDHDVVVFGPVAHLVAGTTHPAADHLLRILGT